MNNTYNPSVRVGNWVEDVVLEEETLSNYVEKRERGELNMQTNFKMLGVLSTPQEPSTTKDGYVHFGDMVTLLNKKDNNVQENFSAQRPKHDVVLALSFRRPEEVMKTRSITGSCLVTGSLEISPTVRNIFEIISCDGCQVGEPLQYGQHFMLRNLPQAGNLYLHSDLKTMDNMALKSRNQSVTLEVTPSYMTEWKALYLHPRFRMEMEGVPVKANFEVVIRHCKTGLNLCVEPYHITNSGMGIEPEVTCNTKLDCHRTEKPVNRWEFKMKAADLEPIKEKPKEKLKEATRCLPKCEGKDQAST